MLARRLAAVFMAFLMVHLTVASSDASCATHMSDAHGAAMSMVGGSMSDGRGMQDHAGAMQESDTPCETPAPPHCCQALASCATMFAAGTGPLAAQLPRRAGIAATESLIPLSELVAPDPPPPKA